MAGTVVRTSHPGLRPWLVVAFSFLALSLVFSTRAAVGLMMPVWELDFGWTRSFTSGTAATALVVMAILAPIAGRLVDLHGSRAVMIFGLSALAAGSFLVSGSSSALVIFLAFGGISAIGFGLVATHTVSATVEQEFSHNKGLATGIATSGSTGGQLLIVPLLAVLLTMMSWRWSFIFLGTATLFMIVCVYLLFPKGRAPDRTVREPTTAQGCWVKDLARIIRMPAFQILFWSYAICGYTTSGVIETHFLPYAATCGFGPVPSATAYGVLSAINLGGMILAGWLTDRVNRPLLLGGIYLIRGVSFLILINVGSSLETLILFAVLFGLVDYSTVPVTASLIATHVGRHVLGFAFGLVSAGHQLGAAAGAYFGGHLFDLYRQYDWVWWSSLGLAAFAGLMVFCLKDKPAHSASLDAGSRA